MFFVQMLGGSTYIDYAAGGGGRLAELSTQSTVNEEKNSRDQALKWKKRNIN